MWTWLISNTCWIWRLSHKEGYPLSTHARTHKCCNWPNPSPNMSPNRVTKPSDFISVLETLSDRWRWQFTFKSFVDIRHPICLCRSLILVSVMTFTEPWAQIFPSFDMGASRLSWATLSSNPSSVWNEERRESKKTPAYVSHVSVWI